MSEGFKGFVSVSISENGTEHWYIEYVCTCHHTAGGDVVFYCCGVNYMRVIGLQYKCEMLPGVVKASETSSVGMYN